jgi:hypothetical protein
VGAARKQRVKILKQLHVTVMLALALAQTRCGSLLSELNRIKDKFDGAATLCAPPAPGAVAPVYATAANWLQFVRNDGTSTLNASGTLCDGTETGLANSCLHGGEMRRVPVTNRTTCEGLTATDALGAFAWRCSMIAGVPQMVTGGLDDERYLSHLIDFTGAGAWRPNAVTVTDACGSSNTQRTVWYTNPIVGNFVSVAATLSLSTTGSIYIFTADPAKNLNLTANGVALVSEPGVILTNGAGSHITASANFQWIEATTSTTAGGISLRTSATRFLTIRGTQVANAPIQSDGGSLATRINFTRVFNAELSLDGAQSGHLVSHVILTNNTRLYHVFQSRSNMVFVDLTTLGGSYGFTTGNGFVAGNLALLNHTAANTTINSLRGNSFADSTFMNVLIVNSAGAAISPGQTAGGRNQFINFAVGNSGSQIRAEGTNDYFSGQARFGGNSALCSVGAGNQGIDAACNGLLASDFSTINGLNFATAFVGRILVNDAQNLSDATGLAFMGTLTDFFRFESRYRGYAREDAAAQFNTAHRGSCGVAESCRIWDMRLTAADVQLRGVLAVPGTNDMFFHRWQAADNAACAAINGAVWQDTVCNQPGYLSQTTCQAAGGTWQTNLCSTRALRNASEIFNDARGNDNGLCESGEACMYAPNFGSYQGHGARIYVGTVNGGLISGVDLYRYAVNGG